MIESIVVFLAVFCITFFVCNILENRVRVPERREIAKRLLERAESLLLSTNPHRAMDVLDCISCAMTPKERFNQEKFFGADDYQAYDNFSRYMRIATQTDTGGEAFFPEEELTRAIHDICEKGCYTKGKADLKKALMIAVETRQKKDSME
jgi:hypothetical protein